MKEKIKVHKETIKWCVRALNKIIDREGQVNFAGLTYDGLPIFGFYPEITKEIKESLLKQVIEADKEKHGHRLNIEKKNDP